MYPTVFEHQVVLAGTVLKRTFFGFCVLSLLLLGYLVDRQMVIRQLRRKLGQEADQMMQLRQQASSDMLAALPGLERFKDCLAMEYRRACNTRQPMSLVTIAISTSNKIRDNSEIVMTYGDALKAISRKLRGEDSIYLFAPGTFGIVLPGVSLSGAQTVIRRLADGLHDASGAESRFSFDLKLINYPHDVVTAREMEESIRGVLPADIQAANDATLRELELAAR